MADHSVFNKKLAPESTMDKVEGLLEHFNLPPKVIAYIRRYQRIMQIGIGALIVAVVAWSLYGSYVEKVTEEGATALAVAMTKTGEGKIAALQKVVDDFSASSSAMWAKIELAHSDMKAGKFTDAAQKYALLSQEVQQGNPLYPLIIYGIAQAEEEAKNYQASFVQYELLKSIKGYESIGYTGMARIEEAQNNIEKAIAIYNNYLLAVADDQSYAEVKAEIDRKIARLKAKN